MTRLGIENIRILAEHFCQISFESSLLEKVVGVFVTPPNSYSAVSDPIDLICSRGGDLTMLEVLTESEMSDDGRKRVAQILQEQRESLRLAMSRPQVQFVLYETHSMVASENEAMVDHAIQSINRAAHARHVKIHKEKKRLEALAEADGANAEQLEKLQGISPNKKRQKQEEAKRTLEDDSSSDDNSESETEMMDVTDYKKVPKPAKGEEEVPHIKVCPMLDGESVAHFELLAGSQNGFIRANRSARRVPLPRQVYSCQRRELFPVADETQSGNTIG